MSFQTPKEVSRPLLQKNPCTIERARLSHLLSLPDNNAGDQPFLAYADKNGRFPYVIADFYPEGFHYAETHPQKIGERYLGEGYMYDENGRVINDDWAPLPSTFQLLELMFDVRISN